MTDDLRPHYDIDYTTAKPNRFAARIASGELKLPTRVREDLTPQPPLRNGEGEREKPAKRFVRRLPPLLFALLLLALGIGSIYGGVRAIWDGEITSRLQWIVGAGPVTVRDSSDAVTSKGWSAVAFGIVLLIGGGAFVANGVWLIVRGRHAREQSILHSTSS